MRGTCRLWSLLRLSPFAVVGAATLVTLSAQRPVGQPSAFNTAPSDQQKRIEAKNGVVTSANGLASDAGLEILRAGGNAVDAAVATAFAIGVVEPQMSGLGSSGAAVVWMKKDGKPAYLDFYAAQPADSWNGHTEPAPAPRERPAPPAGQTAIPPQTQGPHGAGQAHRPRSPRAYLGGRPRATFASSAFPAVWRGCSRFTRSSGSCHASESSPQPFGWPRRVTRWDRFSPSSSPAAPTR